MFQVFRDTPAGETPPTDENESAGTDLVPASDTPPVGRWKWRLMRDDTVIATSEESWAKRSGAIASIEKTRFLVASSIVVERLA